MAARAVAAVVAEGDGLGEGDVEAAGAGDGRGHLGDLEGVGEPGPLMVLGKDEDLGLAGQPPEGGGVQDAVPVALEAGAQRIGLLGPGRCPAPAARVAPGASSPSSSSSALPVAPVRTAEGPTAGAASPWASSGHVRGARESPPWSPPSATELRSPTPSRTGAPIA